MIEASKVPVILFMRGALTHLTELQELPCALSLDWRASVPHVREKTKQVLQGNLDPDLLYASLPTIRQKADELILSMKGDPGFIAGLGHGVKPDSPIEGVRTLVAALQGRL